VHEEEDPQPKLMQKFRVTLAILAVLAGLAFLTLDGVIRIATLIFLGGIAIKSWLVVLKSRVD
jgi:hypothetical protein